MKRQIKIDLTAHDSVLVITGSKYFQYAVMDIAAGQDVEMHLEEEGLYIDPQSNEFDIDGFVEKLLVNELLVDELEVTNLLPLIYPVCIDWYGW